MVKTNNALGKVNLELSASTDFFFFFFVGCLVGENVEELSSGGFLNYVLLFMG